MVNGCVARACVDEGIVKPYTACVDGSDDLWQASTERGGRGSGT
jgi:hypothetical protein